MAVEKAEKIEDLEDVAGFPSADAKLSTALVAILKVDLLRQVNLMKEKFAQQQRRVRGRQILWLIYSQYRIPDTEGAMLDFTDLPNCHMTL